MLNAQLRSFSSCRSLWFPRHLKRSAIIDTAANSANKLIDGGSSLAANIPSDFRRENDSLSSLVEATHFKEKSFKNQKNILENDKVMKKNGNPKAVEEGRPLFPEKSWKSLEQPRVNFNLKNLKKLSGTEKLDLFRDYLNTKSTSEAIYVYETILYNGISNLLLYKDHHNLFRLLLKNPVQYKNTILKIRYEMANNSFIPTAYFTNEYLVCCLKWGELKSALDVLKTALDERIAITLNTWQELFEYHIKLNDQNAWNDAILLYKKMEAATPLVRPSLKIYLQVMSLYSKLGQRAMVEKIYYEAADDNLERLVQVQIKRMKWINEDKETMLWKANARTSLFNAYINSFQSDWKKVYEEFKDYSASGSPLKAALKSSPSTFHLLLKSLEFVSDPKEKRRLYLEYKHALLNDGLSKSDYLHYSLMIEHADSVDEIRSLYRDATTNGLVHVPPSKAAQLDTSFISSLTDIDPVHGLEALEQVLERSLSASDTPSDYRKPYRFVYLKLIDAFKSKADLANVEKVQKYLDQKES